MYVYLEIAIRGHLIFDPFSKSIRGWSCRVWELATANGYTRLIIYLLFVYQDRLSLRLISLFVLGTSFFSHIHLILIIVLILMFTILATSTVPTLGSRESFADNRHLDWVNYDAHGLCIWESQTEIVVLHFNLDEVAHLVGKSKVLLIIRISGELLMIAEKRLLVQLDAQLIIA